MIAAFLYFIKRSRVESNLHYSNETNSVKQDTQSEGDAPVYLSLSFQTS